MHSTLREVHYPTLSWIDTLKFILFVSGSGRGFCEATDRSTAQIFFRYPRNAFAVLPVGGASRQLGLAGAQRNGWRAAKPPSLRV